MHDRNGTPLKVGDEVVLRLRVKELWGGAEYCNANLEYGFGAEHGPANVTGSISAINTKQVLLVNRPAEVPEQSAE